MREQIFRNVMLFLPFKQFYSNFYSMYTFIFCQPSALHDSYLQSCTLEGNTTQADGHFWTSRFSVSDYCYSKDVFFHSIIPYSARFYTYDFLPFSSCQRYSRKTIILWQAIISPQYLELSKMENGLWKHT